MRVKSLIKNADPIPDTAYEGLSARAADELAALVGPGGAVPSAAARRPSRRGFLVAAVAATVAVGIGGVALVSRESNQPGQTGGPVAGPRVADEPSYGSTATLERAADVIVRARLGAGREETVDDIPTTVATATVVAAAKGGTSGDAMRVSYPTPGSGPETAPLTAGREYVLLLEKGEDARYFLVNTTQGWYAVKDGTPIAGKDNGVALSPGVRTALRLTS
ncbi:twin-arginine translocation signal domain-containing protein [Streptomyces sp. NPDC005962]|uniref:twin-arginine translocation signal domain-containing protein n=1 Tax=Streptomyces sp. NPDC005962 TaxID=3154466 RepID=UPI003410E1EA